MGTRKGDSRGQQTGHRPTRKITCAVAGQGVPVALDRTHPSPLAERRQIKAGSGKPTSPGMEG